MRPFLIISVLARLRCWQSPEYWPLSYPGVDSSTGPAAETLASEASGWSLFWLHVAVDVLLLVCLAKLKAKWQRPAVEASAPTQPTEPPVHCQASASALHAGALA